MSATLFQQLHDLEEAIGILLNAAKQVDSQHGYERIYGILWNARWHLRKQFNQLADALPGKLPEDWEVRR